MITCIGGWTVVDHLRAGRTSILPLDERVCPLVLVRWRDVDGGSTVPEDREEQVQLMMRGLEWPRGLLPVCRPHPSHGFLQTGFLALLRGPVVYLGNSWDSKVVLEDLDFTTYPSYWAIYDDGWRVD